MIHLSAVELPNLDWQTQLNQGFKTPNELLHYLKLDKNAYSAAANTSFAMRVPLSFASRMKQGDIHDPLLKQVLPVTEEEQSQADFISDPVGDMAAISQKGLIHKYHGRVLIVATGACAINCRYCFRRSFPYSEQSLNKADRLNIIASISDDHSISEVILSGGDPLILNDQKIQEWVNSIAAIKHIKRLRIHSRLPIVLPARITKALCTILSSTHLDVCMVVHANHANELNDDVKQACKQLREHNICLLNQTVLLKDINDEVNKQINLNENLFKFGILPYYIHLLDKVTGSTHFLVDQQQAIELHESLKRQLPGYLVPKLVKEQPGKVSKTWINN